MPPDSFYNYINKLDSIFITNFPILTVENNVGKKLKNLIDNVQSFMSKLIFWIFKIIIYTI